ncbi:AAA family ATPase [Burkholderia cepacia]|uniref:AAA family ATPase n=1 Tax=Burkholderia cepacia TaxID=292 RepID=UPI002655EB22|nr:AAA family ATPase [Burkholderia cepacia]MDN7900899.1 AAA family ATPase [Burkholderia cepacia]
MTILQEIHAWSKALAVWQQDAIARLYADRALSAADLDDLYALAKAEVGIPDPEGRVAKKLHDAQVAPPANPTRVVLLTAIKMLANVNALANGACLPVARAGITGIYGENGVGKSGYSRVLKKACRARDRREPILPNANLEPGKSGPAQATFETEIDGVVRDLPWKDGAEPPEPMSDIAIFDSHCARAYIDNQGDFAYAPYGLDILEGLVGACNKLKARATAEKAANAPSNAAYAGLAGEQTEVARKLLGIPAKTKAEDIEILATLREAELERLALLNKTLAEADPKQKALALRQKASRLTSLKERVASAIGVVNDEKVGSLQALIGKSNAAKGAAELAATEFKATPGQLVGTGGEEWKALFEAARTFAELNHAGHDFAELPPEAVCPLCQNALGQEGAARLRRFDAFIKATAEKAAKDAHEAAAIPFRAIQHANLDLMFRDALVEEVTEIGPEVAAACTALQEALKVRQSGILQAAGGKLVWDALPKLSDDPQPGLADLINRLLEQSKALDATADEKLKAAMVAERAELDARRRLAEVKAAVLEAMTKHELCHKLQACIDGMETRGISRKSTELSRTTASQELADALNAELKLLKVHHLRVVMKPESPGGKTQFKLTLQLPGGGTPAAILSEGEQRAIAIASFMAEIRLSKGHGGIVLDDPVSSLDHRRRWEVAERLARESLTRQVIVFTHDIYFLLILEQKAEEVGATLTKNYIRRTADGYGVHSEDLPFDVLGTKDRLGRLRQLLVGVRKAAKEGDEDLQRQLTAKCYGQLRLAWERCIEEVLLNGAVQRFGEGVSTQRLKGVTVTDDDYHEIDAGMTKSSKFEHDPAAPVGRLPIPDPDELSDDIERLAKWRETLNKRVDGIAKGTASRSALFTA